MIGNTSQIENKIHYNIIDQLNTGLTDREQQQQQQQISQEQVPRVALMFISKGAIHNEPIWRAFLEAAGRLKLRKQPPGAFGENLDKLYGPLHPPLDPLREEQYPGWRILHGVIDPMIYKVLGLKKDVPASALAELIVDPIRYGIDVANFPEKQRNEILRLLSLFPGYMVKEFEEDKKRDFPTFYDVPMSAPEGQDVNNLAQQMMQQILQRDDILDNPNQKEQIANNLFYAISHLLELHLEKSLTGKEVYEAQNLFSIYVHPIPGYFFPSGSLFEGREVGMRINTTKAFAQHSMVEAEVAVMREALKNPTNHKFVLVSENCIPLHPPEIIWTQLLSEKQSRVNGCRQEKFASNLYRWKKQMKTDILYRRHWRKSAQWFILNRPHAELAVRDEHVLEMFKRYCWSWYDPIYKKDHVCVSDEHAIPTLLASYGLDEETDCFGVGTFTDWKRGGWHPHTYQGEEISPRVLHDIRTGKLIEKYCNVEAAASAARNIFHVGPKHIETHQVQRRNLNQQNQGRNLTRSEVLNPGHVVTEEEEQQFVQDIRKAELVMQGLMGHTRTVTDTQLSQQKQTTEILIDKQSASDMDSSENQLLDQQQVQLRKEAGERIPDWLISQGYIPMPKECSMFIRKFPPQAVGETLNASLDCGGVGLGYWCYDEWLQSVGWAY